MKIHLSARTLLVKIITTLLANNAAPVKNTSWHNMGFPGDRGWWFVGMELSGCVVLAKPVVGLCCDHCCSVPACRTLRGVVALNGPGSRKEAKRELHQALWERPFLRFRQIRAGTCSSQEDNAQNATKHSWFTIKFLSACDFLADNRNALLVGARIADRHALSNL